MALSPSALTSWTDTFESAMKRCRVPGASAVIVENGAAPYFTNYGTTGLQQAHDLPHKDAPLTKTSYDSAAHQEVTCRTLFPIASISKNMAGVALCVMVRDGHIHMDDTLQSHLPYVQVGPPELAARVTIADLVTHHTGLSEDDLPKSRYDLLKDGEEAIVSALASMAPTAPYKTHYQYFNATYYLIPLLIKKYYGGITWQDFLKTYIFEPLGMQRTTGDGAEFEKNFHVQGFGVTMTSKNDMAQEAKISALDVRTASSYNMAGGIFANTHDLAHWIQLYIQCGAPLIPKDIFSLMYVPHTFINDVPSYAVYATHRYGLHHYGLGLKLGRVGVCDIYYHEGAIQSARSIFAVIPSLGFGAAILTNMGTHDAANAAMFALMDEVLSLPFHNYVDDLNPKSLSLNI